MTHQKFVLVIPNIRSGHNVGAMFRTADGAGVDKICICGYSPVPPHKEILKVSLGAEHSVPWEHHKQAGRLLKKLKSDGYKIVALEQTPKSVSIYQWQPAFPLALINNLVMQSTISLFRRLYDHLPPLFPPEVKEKIGHALNHLENDQTITLEEVEDTMIQFGYEAWPWNQAYKEFLALAESKVGEHFLLPKLSPSLQARYREFKLYGGTLRDLHSGNPAQFFSYDDRVELCQGLVDMGRDLRQYVDQEVKGMEKTRYLKRVSEFHDLLDTIKQTLDHLRQLADTEQDHPTLADEIRSQVRSFEYGLCLLGPELNYDAVCQAPDFFAERKLHLNRLKGIHLPAAVDFYSN